MLPKIRNKDNNIVKPINKTINISKEQKKISNKLLTIPKIFPLKELPFEDLTVYVPNTYKQYSKDAWGGYPPPILPKSKQYPHEGRITFGVPQWMKDKYPQLYKN